MKIYKCMHCENLIVKVVDKGVNVICCGDIMEEIIPNTVDAAVEKHVPFFNESNNVLEITVGSVIHPMESEHYIMFVMLEKVTGFEVFSYKPEETIKINVNKDNIKAIYAYCNLHGLWKKEV